MSVAGSSSAVGSAGSPRAVEYRPCPEILALLNAEKKMKDVLKNRDAKVAEEQTKLRNSRKELDTLKAAVKMAPAIVAGFQGVQTMRDMQEMLQLDAEVEELGGVAELQKMKKELEEYEQRKEQQRAEMERGAAALSQRKSTNATYRATLEKHGLKGSKLYLVKWNDLKEHGTQEPLGNAVSFAVLVGQCETKEKNPEADPEKLRLRLACRADSEVTITYVEWRSEPGFLTEVTKLNARDACDTAFGDDNMKKLWRADGPLLQYDEYKKHVVQDSMLAIASHVPQAKAVMDSLSAASGKRARAEVNYSERPSRSRGAGSSARQDEEDVLVSSLARR